MVQNLVLEKSEQSVGRTRCSLYLLEHCRTSDSRRPHAGHVTECGRRETDHLQCKMRYIDIIPAVGILGLPDSPAMYLHLAGRTGRQPVLKGEVVIICPGKSHESLLGWANWLAGWHSILRRASAAACTDESRASGFRSAAMSWHRIERDIRIRLRVQPTVFLAASACARRF